MVCIDVKIDVGAIANLDGSEEYILVYEMHTAFLCFHCPP